MKCPQIAPKCSFREQIRLFAGSSTLEAEPGVTLPEEFMSLSVTEIFYSIQGESLYSGRPCTFVRLSGCNLRCTYCDTSYAYEPGTEMTISSILSQVASHGCPLVEITGGEPLLQEETPSLILQLLDEGYEVMVETNGSLDISLIDNRCTRIIDMKCPTSGEDSQNDFGNLERLNAKDQVKFVIGNREDYAYAKRIISRIVPTLPSHHVLLSPISGILKPSILTEWILADRIEARLHLQLHKIIWPGIDPGV